MGRKRLKPLPPWDEALALLILGSLLGLLFTAGMGWWQAPVAREDALPVTAVLEQADGTYQRQRLQQIRLTFRDHEPLFIDSATASRPLLQRLSDLPPGTVCAMLVHPNSDSTILHLEAYGEVIVDFDEAARELSVEQYGFSLLGVFCFVGAMRGAWLLWRIRQREKHTVR